jgi:putative transposase
VVVQQCIVHLIRNSVRYARRQYRNAIVKALKLTLYRPERGGGERPVRRVRRPVGERYPAITPALVQQLGRVHAIPRVGRRDPSGDLHDERDRVVQRPLPARSSRPWALPHRSRSDHVFVLGDAAA